MVTVLSENVILCYLFAHPFQVSQSDPQVGHFHHFDSKLPLTDAAIVLNLCLCIEKRKLRPDHAKVVLLCDDHMLLLVALERLKLQHNERMLVVKSMLVVPRRFCNNLVIDSLNCLIWELLTAFNFMDCMVCVVAI